MYSLLIVLILMKLTNSVPIISSNTVLIPFFTTTGILEVTSQIAQITNDEASLDDMIDEDTDSLTLSLYIFGDDDERKRYDDMVYKIKEKYKSLEDIIENELNRKKISYYEFTKQLSIIDKKKQQELVDEFVIHDHVIQSNLNEIRIQLFETLNEIKYNCTTEKNNKLENIYFKIYLLNIYEREHRVYIYLNLKAKYPEMAYEQLNLTADHLTYIKQEEENLIDDIKNFSKISTVLEPKFDIINRRHMSSFKQSDEIINEFKRAYESKTRLNPYDIEYVLTILISSVLSSILTTFIVLLLKKKKKKKTDDDEKNQDETTKLYVDENSKI
jgi:hypothetical protein